MDLITTTAVSSPVVVGLVGALRKAGLPDHLAPITSVLLGVLLELGASYGTRHPMVRVELAGVLLGLSASGLYSGGKTMGQKVASVRPFRRGLWLGDPHAGAPAGVHTTAPVVHATSGDPTNSSGAVL